MASKKATPLNLSTIEIHQPVMVRWVDIHHNDDGWLPLEDLRASTAEITTIGFWLGIHADHAVISMDLSDDEHSFRRAYFPMGCLQSVTVIEGLISGK